jgi:predicted hotdog family 3-hydroxylacyl-ACP dehydratase
MPRKRKVQAYVAWGRDAVRARIDIDPEWYSEHHERAIEAIGAFAMEQLIAAHVATEADRTARTEAR